MSLAAIIARSEQERESWKYTSLQRFKAVAFSAVPEKVSGQEITPPRLLDNCLVFVDGVLQHRLCRLPDFPAPMLQGDATHGYCLVLDDQSCLAATPLELLLITTTARAEPVTAATQLSIRLGANGRLTLIERHITLGDAPYAAVLATRMDLAPQAKLVHGKIVQGTAAATHLATTTVTVAQGAYYDNFALLQSEGLTRNEIQVALQGVNAQCNLSGAMLLRGTAHADTTTRILHEQPHGQSREVYKSVLADKAHGVFQGKILVQKNAQKTDGYQLSRALLLSDQAEMDAKPELEIYADDVKCSHGSTVGDLDPEALFYLQARGIDAATARRLLITAFIGEQLDTLQAGPLREIMQQAVAGWLG